MYHNKQLCPQDKDPIIFYLAGKSPDQFRKCNWTLGTNVEFSSHNEEQLAIHRWEHTLGKL